MKAHFIRHHSAGFCDIFILFLIKEKVKNATVLLCWQFILKDWSVFRVTFYSYAKRVCVCDRSVKRIAFLNEYL